MSQVYRSTRSASKQEVTFEDAIITGLAKDGGLFIPSQIPKLADNFLNEWSDLSFQELAFKIMRLYIKESEIPNEDLLKLVEKSYSTFRADDVTPLVKIDSEKNLYLLELFHGPTYAFKDVALQFVGNLFEYFLQRKNANKKEGEERDIITVVGATSGDTGSAAIYGLRNKKDVSVFIMYPTGRVSPLQEEQMTTVTDDNIHTFSVKGTFDDCQSLVKQVFADSEFNDKYHIGAVNSINWARILAQMTYYFYSYFQLKKQIGTKEDNVNVRYVVPSGNFGDILAGFYAEEMGLPISKLVVATNENDILNRFINSGKYDKAPVKVTHSPAMDICVSSNFERFLWYMIRKSDGANDDLKTGEIMANFMNKLSSKDGEFNVSKETIDEVRSYLESNAVSNDETIKTIKSVYENTSNHYILDPHSAVGITTCLKDMQKKSDSAYYISLSTAHPAKFSEVVNLALDSNEGYSFEKDVLPEELKKLSSMPKKIRLIEQADLKTIESAIVEELLKENKA